jgi:hypothetical protein
MPKPDNALVCLGPVKRERGRPSTYTDEIAREICERIAAGETLTAICLEEDMPSMRTVSGWLMRRPEFYSEYARAREAQMHIEAEQIREIADNAFEDYYIDYKEGPNGEKVPYVVVNGESTKRAALRIGARQWRAERLNRRVYGNSVKHEIETTQHPEAGAEALPPGLAWLAGQLPAPETE